MTSKAVVFAYHDIGCTGIEALLNAGYEIAAVFTHADDPRENTFYASVARLCAERGIPLHAPEDVNHPLWLERIRQLRPDFLFSFYYRRLLGAELLACAARGAYNLHGSLLPRYRGRAPANWVLVNGETQTGVTLHRMIERADAGPILAQQAVAIDPEDTALSLHGKLRKAAGACCATACRCSPSACCRKSSRTRARPATSAGAPRRTACSTGTGRHGSCTTWCAR